MRTGTAEELDYVTESYWANPRAGVLIEQAEGRQESHDHAGAVGLLDQAIPLGGEAGLERENPAYDRM